MDQADVTTDIVAQRPESFPQACAELFRHGSVVVTTKAAAGNPWVRTSVMFDGDVLTMISTDLLDSALGPKLVDRHTTELRALTTMISKELSGVTKYVVNGITVAGVGGTIAELWHLGIVPWHAIVVVVVGAVPVRYALGRVARWLFLRKFGAAVSNQT